MRSACSACQLPRVPRKNRILEEPNPLPCGSKAAEPGPGAAPPARPHPPAWRRVSRLEADQSARIGQSGLRRLTELEPRLRMPPSSVAAAVDGFVASTSEPSAAAAFEDDSDVIVRGGASDLIGCPLRRWRFSSSACFFTSARGLGGEGRIALSVMRMIGERVLRSGW